MTATTLREYAMGLLEQPNDAVRLNRRTRNHIEKLPKADWWDLSRSGDGSERLEIRIGSRYYYIYYWTNYLVEGWNPDRCVRVPKDSAVGNQIREMLSL